MNGLTLAIIIFNLFLAVVIGIFTYLLRHETYRLTSQLHLRLPLPVARFLRVTVILPLIITFSIIWYMILGGLFF